MLNAIKMEPTQITIYPAFFNKPVPQLMYIPIKLKTIATNVRIQAILSNFSNH